MRLSKQKLEDMENAMVYDADTKKAHCPRCGTEILRQEFNKCPDDVCGWRQYVRNKNTGDKYFGD
ncbi:hypothetical protein [Paenibacillus sp. FSL H7-0331]|uniref:hypothetical protein n=1 Tax=Paenibacillus sp. FSL H7-0331 TaxID=1920421 RepID=UPI00096F033C|nr:hypothetical protein [Paenibacillus sp. FSL H7-0331]OME97373.1 hypothetical protein BK127_40540 [Paenibacillus sp. FSL H7-0331]